MKFSLLKVFFILSMLMIYHVVQSQDSSLTFKPNIFKYSVNEFPFTFGVSPGIGLGSHGIPGGINVSMDLYHVFICYRYIQSPIVQFVDNDKIVDNAFCIGYRYRKYKNSFSVGAGFGSTNYLNCSGPPGDRCETSEEDTYNTTPIILEYCNFPNPFIGWHISLNLIFGTPDDKIALLGGLKFGIARRYRDKAEK